MRCPNCNYSGTGWNDCGDWPGAVIGLRCPECGECVPDDEEDDFDAEAYGDKDITEDLGYEDDSE